MTTTSTSPEGIGLLSFLPSTSTANIEFSNKKKGRVIAPLFAACLVYPSIPEINSQENFILFPGLNPNIVDHRPERIVQSQYPFLVMEQARLVANNLGLSKSEVAAVFGVSRPTLYAWINGESEPQGENLGRLKFLANLLRDTLKDANRPLFHKYVTDNLSEDKESLQDLLLKKKWDETKISTRLNEAWRQTLQRDAQMSKILYPTGRSISRAQQDRNLLENLSVFPPEP